MENVDETMTMNLNGVNLALRFSKGVKSLFVTALALAVAETAQPQCPAVLSCSFMAITTYTSARET